MNQPSVLLTGHAGTGKSERAINRNRHLAKTYTWNCKKGCKELTQAPSGDYYDRFDRRFIDNVIRDFVDSL